MAAAPHARALQELSDRVRVAGCYSRNAHKCREFASRYGFDTLASLDAISADPSIDVALILTPPDQRSPIVEQLAVAGKHILMEKPLERTTAAAEQLVRCCESHRVALGMVFQHRYRQASRQLRQLLVDGRLGTPCVIQVMVPWWREQSYYDEPGRGSYQRDGGGVLISQAIHTLDLLLHLCGPVVRVQAMAATSALHSMESEDFVSAGLKFANGAVAGLMATTAAYPGAAESIAITTDRASATLASGTLNVHWRDGRVQQWGDTSDTGGGADPMAFPHDWHRDLIDDFITAVIAQRAPAVSAREALQVHRLIDALMESSRLERAVPL